MNKSEVEQSETNDKTKNISDKLHALLNKDVITIIKKKRETLEHPELIRLLANKKSIDAYKQFEEHINKPFLKEIVDLPKYNIFDKLKLNPQYIATYVYKPEQTIHNIDSKHIDMSSFLLDVSEEIYKMMRSVDRNIGDYIAFGGNNECMLGVYLGRLMFSSRVEYNVLLIGNLECICGIDYYYNNFKSKYTKLTKYCLIDDLVKHLGDYVNDLQPLKNSMTGTGNIDNINDVIGIKNKLAFNFNVIIANKGSNSRISLYNKLILILSHLQDRNGLAVFHISRMQLTDYMYDVLNILHIICGVSSICKIVRTPWDNEIYVIFNVVKSTDKIKNILISKLIMYVKQKDKYPIAFEELDLNLIEKFRELYEEECQLEIDRKYDYGEYKNTNEQNGYLERANKNTEREEFIKHWMLNINNALDD